MTELCFATSGHAELAYEVAGDGAPVLLLHAGVTDRRSWLPLVDALVAGGRRTIAFDRRGFGASRWQAEEHSHVDDALAVLGAAGAASAAVVGASMGGRVALDLALEHPGVVERLVLVGSAIRGAPPVEPTAAEAALGTVLEAAEAAEDITEVNRIEAHAWLDGPTVPEGRVRGSARALFLDMNGIALAAPAVGEERPLPAAWDRLEAVRAPSLVVVGELDFGHVRARSQVLAGRIPGARLLELRGRAHLPHLEADAQLLAAVAAFLAE